MVEDMKDIKKISPKTAIAATALIGFGAALIVVLINLIIINKSSPRILSVSEAAELEDVDCILVLGCKVYDDGTPGGMLIDRLDCGVSLYKAGAAPKLLMSGDHGRKEYDEVNAMKSYAIGKNIASSDVFMDHAGFSTYESMYRLKDVFQAKKAVIVTQKYHLYRALYLAESMGIEAYGVPSDYHSYRGMLRMNIREALARVKDFFTSILKPKPKYLGEAIPVFGNGDITNDKDIYN